MPLTFNGPSMRGVSRPIGDAAGISCAAGMFVYSLGFSATRSVIRGNAFIVRPKSKM